MTIDEAIVHAREVASRKFDDRVHCIRCAEEHEQIAEWLEELKAYRAIGTLEECREAVEKQKAKKPKEYEDKFANPYFAAELGYIDDIIQPADTRRAIIRALDCCRNKSVSNPPKKHGNMPM